MKTNNEMKRICPYCNREFTERPAISRTDNKTPICPDCGTRQALETLGISIEEQDKIIDIIHSCYVSEE